MHLPGDIMSQLMHPPGRHFVPLSQFKSPYLGKSLRVSQVYLGYILAWAIFGHISGIYIRKPLFNWHFSGDKMSHPTKCPTFSPVTKCPNLCTDAQESCWKVVWFDFVAGVKVGHFVILGQFVARKMPVKQWLYMSASVGHFIAGEEMGHFVAGTNCRMGRKWDILSSGTICHLGQFVARKMPLGQFVVRTKCLQNVFLE